jgi:iron complex transport system ATP-binding protein
MSIGLFRLTSQSISVETDSEAGQAPAAIRLTDVQVWRWHQASGTRKTLLDDVSWNVRAGEHWALLGPNGAGKTTLLALAAAVDFPSRGQVELLGQTMGRTDVARLRQEIGFVDVRDGERFAPMLTVREVVETGATSTIGYFRERLTLLDVERCEALLGTFGLGPLAERRFAACSQGERKRALIARALMGQPRLLLLDEPGAGLDLPGRELLLAALARLSNVDPTLTVVITTHHVEELPSSTSHAILLRDGSVLAAGPVAQTLTDTALSSCFGMPITVTQAGQRWSAIAASASA